MGLTSGSLLMPDILVQVVIGYHPIQTFSQTLLEHRHSPSGLQVMFVDAGKARAMYGLCEEVSGCKSGLDTNSLVSKNDKDYL